MAYLEADKAENVRFYQQFGFRVMGETDILGVKNYFMWRESRSVQRERASLE